MANTGSWCATYRRPGIVPIVPAGPPGTLVSCLYLPREVRNDTLAASSGAYGKVLNVTVATPVNRFTLRTGTRMVKNEMKENNPVPNFMWIAGHRVTRLPGN